MAAEQDEPQNLAQAITDISERATLIVREEIELAKAEIASKLMRLLTGAIVGLAAGIFVLIALFFVLVGIAWLLAFELFGDDKIFLGFFVVAGGLLLLGCVSGLLAALALRRGSPPTPTMAIDEARKIRETVAAKDAQA